MRLMLPHTPVIEFTDYCVDCMRDFNLHNPCCCDAATTSVPLDDGSTRDVHHEGRCNECCGHTPRMKI
jgi:hypothetical protein